MKDLLAEDYFLLHIPIMISGALLFASFFLVVTHVSFVNVLMLAMIFSLVTIGMEYFGPQLSVNYSGYIPHIWILGALIVFSIQFKLFSKYWE